MAEGDAHLPHSCSTAGHSAGLQFLTLINNSEPSSRVHYLHLWDCLKIQWDHGMRDPGSKGLSIGCYSDDCQPASQVLSWVPHPERGWKEALLGFEGPCWACSVWKPHLATRQFWRLKAPCPRQPRCHKLPQGPRCLVKKRD